MRLLSFILSLSLFLLHAEFATAIEHISCQASGGTATAYYCNTNGGGSASGKVNILIYNENGSQMGSSFCVGVAVAVMGCSPLCSILAPSNAIACAASMN